MKWLYQADPRVKLYFSVLGITLCLMVSKISVLFIILLITQLVLLTGGVVWREVLSIWKGLAPLLLIIFILQPLFLTGSLPITIHSIAIGLDAMLKFSSAAFIVLAMILPTPIQRLVRGFEKLGLPYSISMTIGMALQYFKTLAELYTHISEAQQARGWDAEHQGFIRRLTAVMPRMVALVIASIRLSDALALGLASRGFGVGHKRTVRKDIIMTRRDWILLFVFTVGFAFILCAEKI